MRVTGNQERKKLMIKNMTRKSLAIGTTAALTLAGLVGIAAPASATTGITVEPSKGTSYTMISGEQFDLRVFGQANYTGSFSALRWEITNPDTATVNLRVPADANALAATRPASNPTSSYELGKGANTRIHTEVKKSNLQTE
jgi:hypothetical protein